MIFQFDDIGLIVGLFIGGAFVLYVKLLCVWVCGLWFILTLGVCGLDGWFECA